MDWFVAATPIRKTEVQVNPVSSPPSESYLSTEFQMGTKKVRESLEICLETEGRPLEQSPWVREPGFACKTWRVPFPESEPRRLW